VYRLSNHALLDQLAQGVSVEQVLVYLMNGTEGHMIGLTPLEHSTLPELLFLSTSGIPEVIVQTRADLLEPWSS